MEATSGDPNVPTVTGPPEPAVLDYGAVPQPVAVLVVLLASLSLVGAALLARFLDRTVLRPAWTERDLPCENALYLLFSVVAADLLQAGCALLGGLQLAIGRWFLSRPLCRLWSLLDSATGTARLLFLLAINARLLSDGQWQRSLKIGLVSLLWLLVVGGSYLAVRPIGVRQDTTCGPRHAEHLPAAALWRYALDSVAGLALLPVAVGVYLWYRGRPQSSAAGTVADGTDTSGEMDRRNGDEGSEDNALAPDNEETQRGTTGSNDGSNSDTDAVMAAAAPANPLPNIQRIGKLERHDTFTPSTFTLRRFWGMPSVDELSSVSEFTELGGGEAAEPETSRRRRRRMSLRQVTEVRRRVRLFVLLLSLAHFGFSVAAFVVHLLTELRLTGEDPWRTAALVLDVAGLLQPLTTTTIFSCMFPRFYKMLLK